MGRRKILSVIGMNWCEAGPGAWNSSKYIVYSNGKLRITTCFRSEGFGPGENIDKSTKEHILSDNEFQELKMLMTKKSGKSNRFDCCDGTGWEMTLYSDAGDITYHHEGYIYGDKVLEGIARIISKDSVDFA